MKTLLYKEFKLSANPLTYLFLVFTIMAGVPNYPILVGTFFVCMGLFYTFQTGRETNDVNYTALLPVKKRNVVLARYLFVMAIQIAAVLLSAIFVLLWIRVLSKTDVYAQNQLMSANLAFLGYVFIVFALFNGVFVNGFYKTAYKISVPLILFCVSALLAVGLFETLPHLPYLSVLNANNGNALLWQLIPLGAGVLIYALVTYLSYQASAKNFENLDL